MTTRLPTHLPRPPSPSTDTPFLPSLSTRPFHRCLPPSPHILGHPQRYVRETRTPYYEKRCSRSEPRHFPDCLAAFTRRLLTAGSYSRVAYYAFVGGRFSSILSFSRFTTPASASPLSLSSVLSAFDHRLYQRRQKKHWLRCVRRAEPRNIETESHASRERT